MELVLHGRAWDFGVSILEIVTCNLIATPHVPEISFFLFRVNLL